MMEKTIFWCEDSTEGIFTGVYDAWASKAGHDHVELRIAGAENYELFAGYQEIPCNPEKAFKVARTLQKRMSEDYEVICQASLSKESGKANAIYHTIVMGLRGGYRGAITQNLADPNICFVAKAASSVYHEAHRCLGFVRFRELKNKILYSVIEPDNRILPIIAEHFADRLPNENFLIYDKTHEAFLIHESGKSWSLVEGAFADQVRLEQSSESEEEFQRLWKGFCKSIGIKERYSKKRQQQFVPLKVRSHMLEFDS